MTKTKLKQLEQIITDYIDKYDIDETGDFESAFNEMEKYIRSIYPKEQYQNMIFRWYPDTSDMADAFRTMTDDLQNETIVDSLVIELDECILVTIITKKEN